MQLVFCQYHAIIINYASAFIRTPDIEEVKNWIYLYKLYKHSTAGAYSNKNICIPLHIANMSLTFSKRGSPKSFISNLYVILIMDYIILL